MNSTTKLLLTLSAISAILFADVELMMFIVDSLYMSIMATSITVYYLLCIIFGIINSIIFGGIVIGILYIVWGKSWQ